MPVLTSCPELVHLERLALGQIPEPEADVLEEHVARCARCAEAVTRLTAADTLIAAIQARTPAVAEPDRELVQDLIGRVKALCLTAPLSGARARDADLARERTQ